MILLHLMTPTMKNACGSRARVPAATAVVNARDVRPGGTGLYPELFYAYVLVTSDDVAAGIAGVQFGIQYDGAEGQGVDIYQWILCATLEFQQPWPAWPNSGGGNLITWDATTSCQRLEPGGQGTGVVAVAGYFYCSAFSDDFLRIIPRPADGRARVATCDAAAMEVADNWGGVPGPSRLGTAGFGSLRGYNPALAELIPPAAVTDLAVTGTTTSSATLTWTAPGDDSTSGTAVQYDLRYSTAPIDSANYAWAMQAPGEPLPAMAGTAQGMTLSGLVPGTTYYFALKTADESQNWSSISNVAVVTLPGEIVAWGWNTSGQCTAPVPNKGFLAVAGGVSHSLGLKVDGSVVAWGNNDYGQSDAPAPNEGFVAIAAGRNHNLGLKSDGSIVAWGRNEYGQCNVPPPNAGFVAVAGGGGFSLGLKADGSIVAWGDNSQGQCNVPSPNISFVALGAGMLHSLGLKSDGSIVAWGDNGAGQCNVPAPNEGFVALSAGAWHGLGLKGDGSIVAWGENSHGQCDAPPANSDFVDLAAGGFHSLGLKADGSIVAWGLNDRGQCNVPAPNSGFVAMAGGFEHSIGLRGSPDLGPPRPVTDLAVTATTASSARLVWTVPGGEGLEWSTTSAFSETTNPTGAWSYGWSATLAGTINLYTLNAPWLGCSQVHQWYQPIAPDPAPHLSHNGGLAMTCGGISLEANQLVLHPGPGGEYSILRWTAPFGGRYTIHASFSGKDVDGASTDVHVLRNGSSIFDGYVSGTDIPTGFTSESLALAAGDFVDFRVGYGGNGYLDDTTALDALISCNGLFPSHLVLYDVRYSTAPIDSTNFASASQAGGEPLPAPAGSTQSMTITGLAPSTTYYFAMKTMKRADGVPNWSFLSNIPSGVTSAGDVTPPAAVVDLHQTGATTSSVSLAWTAPGDDGNTGTAAGYDLRYSTVPINASNFDSSTTATGESAPGAAGTPEAMTVGGLAPGTTYYFALKAADEVPNVSGLSNLVSTSTVPLPVFENSGSALPGISYGSAAWADYDDDGDLDFVIAGNPNSLVFRNNNGTFSDAGAGLTAALNACSVWADYDGDGDLDLLVTGAGESGTRLYRNDGGAFVNTGAALPGVDFGAGAFGDYDNDGDLDLLLAGYSFQLGVISRLYRNDSGTFVESGVALPGVLDAAMAWGDFDKDGDLDFVLCGSSACRIYRNDGGGTFVDIQAGLPSADGGSVAWGDCDNDGDLDLLIAGWTGSSRFSRVYRNNGGSFADIGAGLHGVQNASVAWGDYDNDGDLDILLAGYSDSGPATHMYRNDNGTFTEINSGLLNVAGASLASGDYDNDGDLDVLLTGFDGTQPRTLVYRNTTAAANTPPTPPPGAMLHFSATRATFGWSPASDPATPSAGLTYNLRVGSSPGGNQIVPAMAGADGYRRLPAIGNVNHDLSGSVGLSALLGRSHLYWSVQSIDNSFAGSSFGPEQVFDLGATISAVTDVTGDQGGWVRLRISRSSFDQAGETVFPISGYNIWRRVESSTMAATIRTASAPLVLAEAGGPGDSLISSCLASGLPVRRWNGRYFVTGESQATGVNQAMGRASLPPGTWEIVGSFFATQEPQYLAACPTLGDSTASGTAWSVFVVSAHTTTPSVWFMSGPDSGYSIDNIAPGTPTGLSRAATATENRLTWDPAPEIDFQYFSIYRGTDPDFVPGPGSLAHQTAETQWNDTISPPGLYFYKLTAVDHAGNESPPESEEQVSGVLPGTGVRNFRIYPNRPNPFAPRTLISFDLPEVSSRVCLEIYDINGRLIRTLVDGVLPRGHHEVAWDGLDERGSSTRGGVYFCRVRSGSLERTIKVTKM